jgi:hypothetical protein
MSDRYQASAVKCPWWIAVLLRKSVEQMCFAAEGPCTVECCRLRYFCRCSQEQDHTAKKLETILRGSMAVSGAGLILYWLLVR